jgi:hypothetical protein
MKMKNVMNTGMKVVATLILGAMVTAGASASQQDAQFGNYNGNNKTTLSTPPLVPDGNSQLDCYIINVGKKDRYVSIDALDRAGNVVASWDGVIEPGTEEVAIAKASAGPRSCRFVVDGQGKDFRASGLVVVPGIGSISALAAQ